MEYLWSFLSSGQSFLQNIILLGQSHIQGTEQEVPGIYIVGHPPTPPGKVYTVAWITIGVLFILTGILQYFLKKWWMKEGKSVEKDVKSSNSDNSAPANDCDVPDNPGNPDAPIKQENSDITGLTPASPPDVNPSTIAENPSSDRKTGLINFAIIIICILFFFVTLETVLQVYVYYNPYQVFIPDPQSHWKINPAIQRKYGTPTKNAPIDSAREDGIVDFEYTRYKEKDAYRILCYGDSQTMGAPWVGGMPNSYPKMLQKKLQKAFPKRKIQVINMGVSGYSSYQGLLFFRNIGIHYNPDCVVIGLGFHDAGASFAPDREITSDKQWVKTLRSTLYKSQIYLMIRKKILERRALNRKEDNRPVFNRVTKDGYRENLKTFLDMGKENKIKMIFLTVPQVGSDGTMHLDYVDVMRKASKDFDVTMTDAVEAMKKIPLKEQEEYFVQDKVHFNIKGNDFMSDRIFETLKPIIEKETK